MAARLALAPGPIQTTLFVQLEVSGSDEFAMLVPVKTGAHLDWASPALMQSIEGASAVRVLPPAGVAAACPGSTPEPSVYVSQSIDNLPTALVLESLVLPDEPAVQAFAASRGLTVPAALASALATSNQSFFVARFAAQQHSLTPTLRLTTTGHSPQFPLVFSQGQTGGTRVELFGIGPGRAALSLTEAFAPIDNLSFDVAAVSANYNLALFGVLPHPGVYVTEMASHAALRDNLPTVPDGPWIESVTNGYFGHANELGQISGDANVCITQTQVILGQSASVGTACPPAELGVVGGQPACLSDNALPGQVDPNFLRCGPLAEDLALLLSDLEADKAALTRFALFLPEGSVGVSASLSFPGGPRKDPLVVAEKLDLSGCSGGQGGAPPTSGATGSGTGASSSSGSLVNVPVYRGDGCSCDPEYVLIGYETAEEESAPDGYYVGDDGCGTGTESTDESGEDYETSQDDCGGDTSDSSAGGGDGDDDDDGGDDGDDDGDSGGGSYDDGSSDSLAGNEGENCAVAKRQRRPTRPNLRIYALVFVAALARRLSRPSRPLAAS